MYLHYFYANIFVNNNELNSPTVVYLTNVSLLSTMASTANFSQYRAVMMAMLGCFADTIFGICFTTWWAIIKNNLYQLVWESYFHYVSPRKWSVGLIGKCLTWICVSVSWCLVNAPCSTALTSPLCTSSWKHCETSSSDHPWALT